MKITILTAMCSFLACNCQGITSNYPTRDPREIGREVLGLRSEMMASLPRKAESPGEPTFRFCGEEPHKLTKVQPLPADPWQVKTNLYQFEVDTFFQIESVRDAPAIYHAIINNLNRIGGWNASEMHNTANFPAGVSAKKHGIQYYASHRPSPNGKINIHVDLSSSCFKHPNS